MNELKVIVEKVKNCTSDTEKKEYQKQAIDILSELFKEESILAVESINKKPETTRKHYGDYMALLTEMKGLYRLAFAKSLIDNGASSQGVNDALNLLNPSSY